MIDYIKANSASIIICIILAVIVFFTVKKIVNDKKRGKCLCGCENCSMNCKNKR